MSTGSGIARNGLRSGRGIAWRDRRTRRRLGSPRGDARRLGPARRHRGHVGDTRRRLETARRLERARRNQRLLSRPCPWRNPAGYARRLGGRRPPR
ncbi:MAG TPA: hypothetical protein VGT02_16960, partial [Methylomirabilota bacterium]|nr:hypothetical protein [Methylomirabilota bacterium]